MRLFNDEMHMGKNIRKTIDSTWDAVEHYFTGGGEAVNLGINTKNALLNNSEFQKHHNRILTGQTERMSGNFGVNLRDDIFHVGDTRIDYSITCSASACNVDYTLFSGDAFANPFDIGIEISTPYRYMPQSINYNFNKPNEKYY